jgi:hypothetical protein
MDKPVDDLEQIWSDLLSRQTDVILLAFEQLDPTSRQTVIDHLRDMANDPGWQPEQRESALVALKTLEPPSHPEK